jgi:hypothetical protein
VHTGTYVCTRLVNKDYLQPQRLIVKKCKKGMRLISVGQATRSATSADELSAKVLIVQSIQLNFATMFLDRSDNVEGQRQGTPAVFE